MTIFAGFLFSVLLVSLLIFNLRRSRVVEKEAVIVLFFFEKVYRQNANCVKRHQGQPAPQAVKDREK